MNKDLEKVNPTNEQETVNPGPTIIQTDVGAKDGQNKCPKCGATDISTNVKKGKLRCNFCRYEFEPEKLEGMHEDISTLEGFIIGSGASDIVADTKDVLTFKCSSCGAEVVIDTSNSVGARCHWCRNQLSVNQQIPNGSIPDVVLPFSVTREDARALIDNFVGKRKFFANPKFRAEFTSNNVMGVYFPYMLVDVNGHANMSGEAEHLIRSYTVKTGENSYTTYYDAEAYYIEREFDISINGLSIESNSDRLNNNSKEKTNNIINSIMPFDTENCVKYNANYLKGYTSEKRDTNIQDLQQLVSIQAKDIARYAALDTMKYYDRGAAWKQEDFNIKGQQWKAAYLPVWLYSYQEVKGQKKLLHYVAVNARTKETMGSVPIHQPKLLLVSAIIEVLSGGLTFALQEDWDGSWILLSAGIIFYLIIYARYRNKGARHTYENETKKEMANVRAVDRFIGRRNRLENARIRGMNSDAVYGASVGIGKNKKSLANTLMNNTTVGGVPLSKIANKNKK